jgi:hypothetical protein
MNRNMQTQVTRRSAKANVLFPGQADATGQYETALLAALMAQLARTQCTREALSLLT